MAKHEKNSPKDEKTPVADAAQADSAASGSFGKPDMEDQFAENGPETTGAASGEAGSSAAGADAEAAYMVALAEKDARIKALEEEVSSLKDQYLRKLADYENFRKRMFREKEDAVQFANSQLLGDLVNIVDDFDRAVHSSETSRDFQSLHDGIDMIRKGMISMLENRYGLQRFESLNTVFDPNIHEAMMSTSGDCAEPMVIEEFSKGYKLRDRILRTAKVKVCMPGGAPAASAENQTTEENTSGAE
ncbi:MAG: nucleotide exchange factor GrpE [Spirochaetes bacterium]|nr:nucleotide exchange factor GrpE [Spirochaetota bacterium]MBU0954927.1 nucleotide exchange factor GrpE [Spirochaetota bacterium]